MKISSILCRRHEMPEPISNPFPDINGEFVENEDGERKFVPRPVVAPSMADDFSVISNSLRNRLAQVSRTRENIDPVDLIDRHPELKTI